MNLILREVVETRELLEKLSRKLPSQNTVDLLEEKNKTKLNADLRSLAERIVDENYKGGDAARKNELKNAVDGALKAIAKKVSQGVQVEMKYIPTKRDLEEGQEEDADAKGSAVRREEDAFAVRLNQEVALIDFSTLNSQVVALLGNDVSEPGASA